MSLLIINTLPPNSKDVQDAIRVISKNDTDVQVFHTYNQNISHCLGCYTCMLRTPGICCIKDDFTPIFKAYKDSTKIVFISDTSLNFVSHELKNIIDRSFPLVKLYTCFKNGEIRHLTNHNNNYEITLLYQGNVNHEFLNEWLFRVASQLGGESRGAYPISNILEVI